MSDAGTSAAVGVDVGRAGTRALRSGGLGLGHLFGIEIVADWSLLIVFALISVDLGTAVLPARHPEWSAPLTWATSMGATVLFFASILTHELAHALVARKYQVTVRRITLFMFGGVAQLDAEPPSPRAELTIAIAGPLTSIALGVIGTGLGLLAIGPSVSQLGDVAAAERALSSLGPLPTLLLWLGPVNLTLGFFNLVPGFPMDGGRVLRAAVWWLTGDLGRATRVAANVGRVLAMILFTYGVWLALGGDVASGIWLALIGWFVFRSATVSLRDRQLRDALADVPITALLRRRFDEIPPELTVSELVEARLLSTSQPVFPVARAGELLGVVGAREVFAVPPGDWPSTAVAEIMRPAAALTRLPADATAERALDALNQTREELLPVVDGGMLIGWIGPEEIMKWIELRAWSLSHPRHV
ncbi:MAG: site-2 protease family protein [Sandaracinaceae bacterium]